MDVLLTGATGYVGSRVAVALEASGARWSPLGLRLEAIPPGSLACDVVIHCAGALRSRAGQEFRVNAAGTRSLLAGLARPARIVFLSTRSVYPLGGHVEVMEDAEARPFDAYGQSKLEAEQAILASGHRAVLLRSGGIFGHPTRSGTFPDHAMDRMLAGQGVDVAVPDRLEDYVDVEWLARILVEVATSEGADGQVLNVAGPARSLSGMLSSAAVVAAAMTGRRPVLRPREMPLPAYPLLGTRRLMGRVVPPVHPGDEEVFRRMALGRCAG